MPKPPAAPVALVTGAAKGIGLGIVRLLLTRGWRVALADREGAAKAAETLGRPDEVLALKGDVGNEADVKRMVRAVVKRFGRLDGLVCNAGHGTDRVPVTKLALKDWSRVIATNLTGTFLCAKHAAPALRKVKGAIVTMASTRAYQSEANTEAYAASKGGIVALTHALAISLGPDVRVNCVSPGWIETGDYTKLKPSDHEQHPAGRVGRPEDIAELTAFLLSPAAGFITGQDVVADGGMTKKMQYEE